MSLSFEIEKRGPVLARAGLIETPHGVIKTPAFIVVATKAAVKAVVTEAVQALGAQAVLGNTYHLYFEPGAERVRAAGGLGKFMNWTGPTFTDSGGFQVFSLGAGYGKKLSKVIANGEENFRGFTLKGSDADENSPRHSSLVKITDDGVEFRSPLDGSKHFFTPECSIEIQHDLGADIIFAFDECTSPEADYEYQQEAMGRTHAWAARSLAEHRRLSRTALARQGRSLTALFGIVQGGRYADLREASARAISALDFDGFGIGGSFDKEDIAAAAVLVNKILPEEKPRHLLGIGAVEDIFAAVEAGCDTFDCVSPTRLARHAALETSHGRLNLLQAKYRDDLGPPEAGCACLTCRHYTRAYLAHLFRAGEMTAATLASIHNLHFFVNLLKQIRQSILDGKFEEFRDELLATYQAN